MRRWLHSLLVALLCLTLFMDSARACRYVRHRGRRVAACPPPALPAVPCCPPIGYGDPFTMPAGFVVVRDVPCGPDAWGGMEWGGAAWTPIASSHVISDVTSDVIVWDRPVGDFVATMEDSGCACGSVTGWHEGHAAEVIEHGVIHHDSEHGVIEHGVIEHGVIEHGSLVHDAVVGDTVEHGVVDYGTITEGTVTEGTVEHGVVKHAPTIVTDAAPRTAGRADLPAAENPAPGDIPLALPPQRASAMVPQAVAPQAAAALPDLIAPTSGQAPAKPDAPAADGTRSVIVDPSAGPADDAAAAAPAMKREIAPEPAADGATDPFEPTVGKPAGDDAREEMPADEADRTPAVAPQKPRAVNLFDEIDDEAPADDLPGTDLPGATEPADEPVMVDDPADAPLDDAPRADADAEMADEPESDEAPAEAIADDAGTDEPERVEEPATEEAPEEADASATPDADDADEQEPAEPANAAACTPPAEPMRRWVDGTGRHHTRGWLVEATATHVRILKVNGRFTTVNLDRLSAEDRDYVSDVVVRTAAGRRATPPRIDTAGL